MIYGWSAFWRGRPWFAELDWKEELGRWLKPFLNWLGHKARRQMCPHYVSELIGPGDRKSIQPMTDRLALGEYDRAGCTLRRFGKMILSRLCERLPEHFTAPAASHDEDFVVLEPGEMALHHVLAGGARITHTIRYL